MWTREHKMSSLLNHDEMVVIEKEMKAEIGDDDDQSNVSGGGVFGFWKKSKTYSEDGGMNNLPTVNESGPDTSMDIAMVSNEGIEVDDLSQSDQALMDTSGANSADGAPMGHAYQAESPDEGALVSAASQEFGFQLKSRGKIHQKIH